MPANHSSRWRFTSCGEGVEVADGRFGDLPQPGFGELLVARQHVGQQLGVGFLGHGVGLVGHGWLDAVGSSVHADPAVHPHQARRRCHCGGSSGFSPGDDPPGPLGEQPDALQGG